MNDGYDLLVRRVLDGELELAQLPPALRPEAEAALRLLAAADRSSPAFSPWFEQRVMAEVRRRPAPGRWRLWAWLVESRQVRIRPRLALAGAGLGLVTMLALWPLTPRPDLAAAAPPGATYVRFVLYAPGAHSVALAGSFNGWDSARTPLVPAGANGFWTATVALPAGQHLYGFVLDGGEWLADPGAPAVDDGFGRRNSVINVAATDAVQS